MDEVLSHSDSANTVGHRSGMAVDDSALFENTTLPSIDMDLSSDPDIVNVWKKSYSVEDITSVVDDTDSDSSDTVSNDVVLLYNFLYILIILVVICAAKFQKCRH